MFTTLMISLREFLEVFLIIGVFLGISKKLRLKREKEILIASFVGIIISFLLPITVFLYGDRARLILNEENADLLGSYLMVFSGFFIAYVVFSLHKTFALRRSRSLIQAHQKLQQNVFDISLFFTIVFFVIREGFEIALFTATTSLFSRFVENLAGLFIGFTVSSFLGILTFVSYMKFSIGKVFKVTEYLIILLGASFVKNGVSELVWQYFHINLSSIIPVNLYFIPSSSSYIGHLLNNLFGIEQSMSLVKILIMAGYMSLVSLLFLRKRTARTES